MKRPAAKGLQILTAASLVSVVLGSIHAFSVFLEPLEVEFGTSRSSASLVYSFSLVFLTATVLFGPAIYNRLQPAKIFLVVAILGASGVALAGVANDIALVWVGYSVIFGVANGLGYGFGLQFAARANPSFTAFSMGVVTAAYALGAVLAPYGFEIALANGGFHSAMIALAICILLAGLIAAGITARSTVQYSGMQSEEGSPDLPISQISYIWIMYGAAVAAGLMAIGHAAAIANLAGLEGWVAPAVLAGCNLIGSLLFGILADRNSHRVILTILPLISAISLFTLAAFPQLTFLSIGLVGFAYGGTIAVFPAAISKRFSGNAGPRVYGRVFTAWGLAGLSAPWFAGKVFDLTGGYEVALWVASGLALMSALLAVRSKGWSVV